METWLDDNAREGSTAQVTYTFTDQDGNAFTPKTLTWTLLDGDISVVNSREDVVVTPAATVSVVIYGADLAMNDETLSREKRTLRFEGTYDSGSYTDLPFVQSVNFYVINEKGD